MTVLWLGLMVGSVHAQITSVSGTVRDEMETLIGATVCEVDATGRNINATITDFNGHFAMKVKSTKNKLKVSFMGYKTQTLPINRTVYNITLESAQRVMKEVSVVSKKRLNSGGLAIPEREVSFATQTISTKEFEGLGITTVDEALQGRIAGLDIISNSGNLGSGTTMRLRGTSSISTLTNQNPLIVVNGNTWNVDMSTFDINSANDETFAQLLNVNPEDIEEISVLKDAAATAIYGSQGANGVIEIKTKRGKRGAPAVSYSLRLTGTYQPEGYKMLTGDEYTMLLKESYFNPEQSSTASNIPELNYDPTFSEYEQYNNNTDWQDEATRTAISHNHQLNVQQGGEKSSMGAFLNYTDNQGIMLNTYSKRLNAKIAYDANPTTWLSTAVNLAVNHTWGNSTPEDGGGQDARRTMIEMVPWMPVQYNGKYTSTNTPEGMPMDFEAMSNPVHILKTYKNMNYNTKVFGNAALTFHIIEGLDLKTQFGVDANFKTLHKYMPSDLVNLAYDQHGRAERYHANTLYWQEETYLTYNKTIGEHRINAMAGLSWQERKYDYSRMYTENFTTDFFEDFNMDAGTKPDAPKTYWERWSMNSYFLRFAYTFKDRYSATITGRYDGSSKFGKNNKYAFFPSAGLAWNITQEDFMSDQNTISNLKLHTSYGLTGNSEIGVYKSLATVKSETLLLNGTRNSYSYLNRLPNSDLKWEKTAQFDIGFDLGLFNNRITLDASYYNKKTSDLLLDAPVPHTTGFETVYKNIGSIRNQGLDLMLSTRNIDTKDFTWTTSINANFNKNKILSLGDNDEDILKNEWVSGASILRVGESVGSFYGYKRLGVYTIEDYEAGNCQKKQIGRAKRSSEREIIGKGVPDWSGSMINTLRYKNWDFTLDLQFVAGVQTLQQFYHSTYDRFGQTNGLTNILYDAYNGTNPNSMQQAIWLFNGGHAGQDTLTDSQWVANGSYLRANLIQLGYTFDSNQLAKTPFSSLRLYLNVNNAFLITAKDFNGYDPESTSQISTSNGSVSPEQFGQNMAFFSYPRARTFTLGVNVTF